MNNFNQHYCSKILKPYYIAYKRAHADLLYKLDNTFHSCLSLNYSLNERFEMLSWYIKECYDIVVSFKLVDEQSLNEIGVNDGNAAIKCVYCEKCYDSCDIRNQTEKKIETIFKYWFERDFTGKFSDLHSEKITEIIIKFHQLPIIKRPKLDPWCYQEERSIS